MPPSNSPKPMIFISYARKDGLLHPIPKRRAASDGSASSWTFCAQA